MNDLGIRVTRDRILPSKLTRIRVQFSWNRPSFSRARSLFLEPLQIRFAILLGLTITRCGIPRCGFESAIGAVNIAVPARTTGPR